MSHNGRPNVVDVESGRAYNVSELPQTGPAGNINQDTVLPTYRNGQSQGAAVPAQSHRSNSEEDIKGGARKGEADLQNVTPPHEEEHSPVPSKFNAMFAKYQRFLRPLLHVA